MARSVVIETNTVKCASLSRRAAEPSAFTSHMAGEIGLEPISHSFGDCHFSLNYSPIFGGQGWSCTNDVSCVGVLQTLALATRHTYPYKYWRWESNPQKLLLLRQTTLPICPLQHKMQVRGIGPPSYRLKGDCITTMLHLHISRKAGN